MTQVAQKTASVIARVEFKKNGIVSYRVASSSGHSYNVVVFNGKVSSCERTDGEPCNGWRYQHKCHHTALVAQRETERKQPVHVQVGSPIYVEDIDDPFFHPEWDGKDAERTAYLRVAMSLGWE